MLEAGRLQLLPVSIKFMLLLTMFFSMMVCALLLSGLLNYVVFGVNTFTHPELLADYDSAAGVNMARWAQGMVSFFSFIVTPLVCAWMFATRPLVFLGAAKFSQVTWWRILAVMVLMLASLPWINYAAYVNGKLSLPQSLSYLEDMMRAAEDKGEAITLAFLNMESVPELMLTLVIMAVIPAVGEELLFRGMIQQLFNSVFRNKWYSIIITATIFSAIHFQFYGFLPRFLLGVVLGLLMEWSGSVWIPVLAHLFNNGLAVVLTYFSVPDGKEVPLQDSIGTLPQQQWMALVSVLITMLVLAYLRQHAEAAHRSLVVHADNNGHTYTDEQLHNGIE